MAVSRGEAIPVLLLQSTVKATLGGGIGNSAAALAQGALKTMFLSQLAGITALVLTVALAASATIALVQRGPAAEAPEDTPPVAAARRGDADKTQIRMDAQGDPLPNGAIARLGSQRLRHAGGIALLTFTPDGKRLVSQGSDGVRVWDAATGKELRRIAPKAGDTWGHSDLSPDGKWVAVSGHVPAGPVELWEVESGKKIAALGERFYLPVRFSPDGKLLATSAKLTDVDIWDLETRKKLRSWQAHPMQAWAIVFSADSRQLLTSGTTGEIRLWDAATGRQLQEFKPLGWQPGVINTPNTAALSPDGTILALIESNEKQAPAPGKVEWKARISLRDTATGKQIRLLTCTATEIIPGYASPFTSLLFRRDGKKLLTGGPDEYLREWDIASGQELRRIAVPPGKPSSLALSPDEKQLAAIMVGDASIRLVDLDNGKAREDLPGHRVAVGLVALTPDGRTAITGSFEGSALVWDVAGGTVQHRFDEHKQALLLLQLTPDGRTLFSNAYDNHIRVWDIDTGKQLRAMKIDRDLVRTGYDGLVVARDGKTIALVDRTNTIRVLDGETGQERQHFRAPESIYGLALPPGGRSVVGWSGDRKVHVWDIATGAKRHEYALPRDREPKNAPVVAPGGPEQRYYRAALSPDGRLFAMGTQGHMMWHNVKPDNWLIIKDLTTGQDVHHIHNPPSDAAVLTFSPDGRTLAYSGASDTTIRFLEVASGRERHRVAGHRGQINALSFSATGDRLISGCADTTALVWDLGLRPAPHPATVEEVKPLWTDLAGTDAVRAYQAIRKLAATPSSAVPMLRKFLRPIPSLDEKQLAELVAALDSDDFAKREKATAELQRLGAQAVPAYRKALEGKPSLESRRRVEDLLEKAHSAYWNVSGEHLRSLRAVEVLESIDTQEAREVLRMLAAGAAGVRLTEEAKAALERLASGAASARR